MSKLQSSSLPRLDSWRLAVDDADELMLVGKAEGEPVAGRLSTLDRARRLAAIKDGRRFVLGKPDPALGDRGRIPPCRCWSAWSMATPGSPTGTP